MLLEIGGSTYNRHKKDIEKFENVIKGLLQKCDEKSLRMLELLNEEVKAKEARAEDPDDFITMRIPGWLRWNEPFPDEYPSLEKLEKRHNERVSIAVEHHRKKMAGKIKSLRDLYGSGEDDETLLKRHIFEEAAKLTKERLERSKVKKQVMAGYISDCLKVITDWAADLDNFVPWANWMLVECIGQCGNRIPTKISGSASIDTREKNSWRTIWEAIKPFQEKIQRTKDYLCASHYTGAVWETIWNRYHFLDNEETEQTLPELAECEKEGVKEVMKLIDLFSEYDRNGKTPEKEEVSDKLYNYFSCGSNRVVLGNLPVEYALTLSGCGIGVNAVKDCFALVKRFIVNNQGKADYVPEYADSLAHRTNYVCTTDFSYSFKHRTLKYLREEMKQLHGLHPDHERPQSRYAELLFSIINDSSTGKKAGAEYQKELRSLAWAHPGNKIVRSCYRQARGKQ